jgi:hypothetical protein
MQRHYGLKPRDHDSRPPLGVFDHVNMRRFAMVESRQNPVAGTQSAEMRWKDLYRIGGVACIIVVALVMLAIIAFFIWPYAPGSAPTEDILIALQDDMLGGLVSLDTLLPVIELVTVLPLLALYVALKHVNESYALVALVLGLIAVVFFVVARPLSELVLLSEKYATATSEVARSQYVAAGEALLALFDGTAWITGTAFIGVSALISSLLMLRSDVFSKTTAYAGIIASAPGFGFFIPVIGPVLLFVVTFGGVIWYILIARTFFRLGWDKPDAPHTVQ